MLNIPEVADVDIVFSCLETDPELLKIATEKGFYCGRTKYNDLFAKIFFGGEKPEVIPKDIDDDYKTKLLRYFQAYGSTFSCKHEEKDAVCALILSELVEL